MCGYVLGENATPAGVGPEVLLPRFILHNNPHGLATVAALPGASE